MSYNYFYLFFWLIMLFKALLDKSILIKIFFLGLNGISSVSFLNIFLSFLNVLLAFLIYLNFWFL